MPTPWAEGYKYQMMPHDVGQIRRSLERKFNLTLTTSGTNQSLLPTSIVYPWRLSTNRRLHQTSATIYRANEKPYEARSSAVARGQRHWSQDQQSYNTKAYLEERRLPPLRLEADINTRSDQYGRNKSKEVKGCPVCREARYRKRARPYNSPAHALQPRSCTCRA